MMSTIPRYVPGSVNFLGWVAVAIGVLVFNSAFGDGIVPAVGRAEGGYQGPCALVASHDGRTLYVASADARQVVWVDLSGCNITRRLAVPAEPTGLALSPDGMKLVVTCAAPKSTVAVFDAVSGKPLATIRTGHTAMSPAISPDGNRIYVCNRFSGDVSVIDLVAGNEVARVLAVREPVAAAITPDGRAVLVANHLPNAQTDKPLKFNVTPVVTVIDTRTHETTAIELPHGANSLRGLCVSVDGRHAFVTHLLANFEMIPFRVDNGWIDVNVVSVIDIRQRKVVSTIGLDHYYVGAGNPWDVTLAANGESVCVSLAGTHELCVIPTSDLLGEFARRTMQPMMAVWPIYLSLGESLWRRIKLPGNGPRGLTAAGSKVYVAQYFSDTVAVVDLKTAEAADWSDSATQYSSDTVSKVNLQTADAPSIGTIALGPPPQLTPQRRGELLFQDATICYQHWVSCASCHPDGRTDGLNWDLMNDGAGNPKNTKSMLFAHRTPPSMSEGVRESAEEAVRSGVAQILFSRLPEEEAQAIDAYLQSLQPVPSPHLIDGRLSPAAERGRELFQSERVACHRCHPAPLYTDLRSHNVQTRSSNEYTDRFDTPSLIEVWRTAPYLHDGRYLTVKELLTKGNHGFGDRRGNELSNHDIDDLVEFVLSL